MEKCMHPLQKQILYLLLWNKESGTYKYLPILQNWDEPYFVTLTVKAVHAKN